MSYANRVSQEHKTVNLYGGQIDAYQEAKAAVLKDVGKDDLTEGEVVQILADRYTTERGGNQ